MKTDIYEIEEEGDGEEEQEVIISTEKKEEKKEIILGEENDDFEPINKDEEKSDTSMKEVIEVNLMTQSFRIGSNRSNMKELLQVSKEIQKLFFNGREEKKRDYFG